MKVIVGVHAVMANGGIIAPVGLRMVALAARTHAIPFVVLAGMHEVCVSTQHLSYKNSCDSYRYTKQSILSCHTILFDSPNNQSL